MGRSVAKALIIDADGETFERKPTPFTGLADLLDRFQSRLAAASRIPVTILMGEAPAGLNATGDADIRKFYDRVASYQHDVIKPALEIVLRLLLLEQGTEPGSWCIEFNSLYQQTEAEIADTRLKVAQADNIYATMGALFPEEIALSRFTPEGWSMETQIDQSVRKELVQHAADNALATAQDPAPTPGDQAKQEQAAVAAKAKGKPGA
jgi:phage-related protein (TIGR01555 family)